MVEEVEDSIEVVEDSTEVEEAEVVEDLDAVEEDLDAVVAEVVLTDSKTTVLQIMLLVRSSTQIKRSDEEQEFCVRELSGI